MTAAGVVISWAKGEWRGTCGVRASAPGGHRLGCRADDRCRRGRRPTPSPPTATSPTRPSSTTAASGSSTARRAGRAGSTSRSTSSTASCPARTARPGSTSSRTARPSSPSTSTPSRGQVDRDPAASSRRTAARPRSRRPATSAWRAARSPAPTPRPARCGRCATTPRSASRVMSAVDRQSEPLAKVGEGAALAVSQRGTVVVTSAETGTVTTLVPSGAALRQARRPRTCPATPARSPPSPRWASGSSRSTRTPACCASSAAPAPRCPPGSVLQQAGPDADAVLVGAPEAPAQRRPRLRRRQHRGIDAPARPVEPSASAPCVFGAWSGGSGRRGRAVRVGEAVTASDLGGDATSLAFRVNRGEIVLNDANSGTVWDVEQEQADQDRQLGRLHLEEEERRGREREREPERGRPATAAGQARRLRRPRRAAPRSCTRSTTTRPPRAACSASSTSTSPPAAPASRSAPTARPSILQMPEKGRPARFDYFIDDGRDGLAAHADGRRRRARRRDENEPPEPARGLPEAHLQGAARRRARPCPVLADWRDDSDGDTLLLDSARPWAATRPARWPARPPTAGSASPRPRRGPTASSWSASSSP